ncbi:MAG: HD domain-containing protein [Desulfovibrio sp.]|jgi:Predicted hydrolases of HD superfamily|nr:HD domain-containing protein [Desulfovibrio sp.]
MPHVRKNMLQFVFSGSYLLRWNDKLRPMELQEIDKQAHKLLVAYILFNENSREMQPLQKIDLARQIIEGALFDYLYRLIITDIKPPVFYKIRENREHYRQLTAYVLSRLEPIFSPLGPFWDRMTKWHLSDEGEDDLAHRILKVSHLYASRWEFNIIKPANPFDEEMGFIHQSFEDGLANFRDLAGVQEILYPGALASFASLCGQLRFQIRWTQVPRIPATSVLGHMFLVATYGYFFSMTIGACQARANNNFFGGLLHDLAELLTRDIISPVKQSIPSLPEIIKQYEISELERRILNPLKRDGFEDLSHSLRYHLGLDVGSEFQDCYFRDGKAIPVNGFQEMAKFNMDNLEPKDGQLLKMCDWLAAFLEAHSSIRNGISSPHLVEAQARLKEKIWDSPLECLNLNALLADFD